MNGKNKIYHFCSEFDLPVGGIHKVLLSIHNALKSEYESNILGTVSYDKINPDLNIKKNEYEYINLSNLIKLNHSVIFVHERKFLFLFHLFIKLFLLEIDVIYIHHSLLYGHKYLTWFPDHVVGISDSGIENLISYFGVPSSFRKSPRAAMVTLPTVSQPFNPAALSAPL